MTTPLAVTGADLQLTERVDQALQQFRLGLITARERQAQTDKAFAIYRAGIRNEHGEPTNRLGIEANPQPGQ